MKRLILLTASLAVLILAGVKFFPLTTTKAAPQEVIGACVAQVPAEWGQFKGVSAQTGITFEDADGTLRLITNFPCNGATPQVALEIRRTPGN